MIAAGTQIGQTDLPRRASFKRHLVQKVIVLPYHLVLPVLYSSTRITVQLLNCTADIEFFCIYY
jgi:hypothetical protein